MIRFTGGKWRIFNYDHCGDNSFGGGKKKEMTTVSARVSAKKPCDVLLRLFVVITLSNKCAITMYVLLYIAVICVISSHIEGDVSISVLGSYPYDYTYKCPLLLFQWFFSRPPFVSFVCVILFIFQYACFLGC